MAFYHVIQMAQSNALKERIIGCAALEGHGDPRAFAERNIMKIVAAPGWVDQWEVAKNKDDPRWNPDTGARTDVIDDAMILAVVGPLVVLEQPPVQ